MFSESPLGSNGNTHQSSFATSWYYRLMRTCVCRAHPLCSALYHISFLFIWAHWGKQQVGSQGFLALVPQTQVSGKAVQFLVVTHRSNSCSPCKNQLPQPSNWCNYYKAWTSWLNTSWLAVVQTPWRRKRTLCCYLKIFIVDIFLWMEVLCF